MTKLVYHHVVDARRRRKDKVGIQVNYASLRPTAPPLRHTPQHHLGCGHAPTQALNPIGETPREPLFSMDEIPSAHQCLDPYSITFARCLHTDKLPYQFHALCGSRDYLKPILPAQVAVALSAYKAP